MNANDEMAVAHAEDMHRDGRLRDLRDELEWLHGTLPNARKREVIAAAVTVVDEERAQIVRRWD